MTKTIKIQINGKSLAIPAGTRVEDLLAKSPHKGRFSPIGAIVNNRLEGLYFSLKSSTEVRTVDLSEREGMDIYRRTTATILYAAMAEVAPNAKLVVGQSISNGYFFEVHNHAVEPEFIKILDARMRDIIKKDLPIEPEWTSVEEAIDIISQEGDKESLKLLRQTRRSEVPLILIRKYRGIAYGPLSSHTGLINLFRIIPYEHGIVLDFPDENGKLKEKIKQQPKLFSTYLETKRWNELVGIQNVGDLNEKCMGGGAVELVQVAEALHEKKIAAIADEIAAHKKTRIILVAGPSGSGKTTFSKRLSIHLKIHGLETVTISMDNYYHSRDDVPRHPDGTHNFESLEALDIKLFNDHIKQLMRGKEVEVPYFSFPLGRRDLARSKKFKLRKDQILLTEGIHGLNEALTPTIPAENKFKIYVSALTQLCLDDHNRIFTTDTRLCRRIIRDRLFRGTLAAETIAGWSSVRAGENKYIFPFQEEANIIFNSALSYEHALFKPYAERFLTEVPREHPSFAESSRLIRFFSLFTPILTIEVPHTSIIREFIGGSAFKYT